MSHHNDPAEDARAEQLAWVRTEPKAPIPTPSPYPMIRFAEPAHPFDRPVRVEADIDGLECVQGAIPAHLDGTYYKVVSDRQFPSFVENDLGYFNDEIGRASCRERVSIAGATVAGEQEKHEERLV